MILAIHDVSTGRPSAMECHFNQMGTKLTLVYKKVGEKKYMEIINDCCREMLLAIKQLRQKSWMQVLA